MFLLWGQWPKGNTIVRMFNSYNGANSCGNLWKTRAADGAYGPLVAMRACSACAGDYEDPDRTAGEPDEEIEEGPARGQEDLPAADEEGFPAAKD
jgi:hypothetical protein